MSEEVWYILIKENTMNKKIVSFGEIMLRLAAPGYLRFSQAGEFVATYCGGEANVAVSLANFGMEVEFVTRLPKNDIADACLKSMHKHGVVGLNPSNGLRPSIPPPKGI